MSGKGTWRMLRKLMWRYTIILSKCVYKVRRTAIATFFLQ
ncbi:hypothetical protein [Escherichia coli ISC7]|uniref:Uncharacterized protein n=1 Tax=Escherichia coli ISC7 TaxID=1432555 RepID=W1ERG2_ECOLX|nr:hypothetical protein [Escherichia coli ISC7]